MKKLFIFATLVLTTLAVQAQSTIEVEGLASASPDPTSGTSATFSGTVGWAFTPAQSIAVNGLGLQSDMLANWGPATVGLWAADGTLLASTNVTSANALLNQTRYETITPVVLLAGKTYVLGVAALGGQIGLTLVGGANGGSFTLANQISSQSIQLALGGNGTGFQFPTTVGADGQGVIALGPNFEYSWTVPEPSTGALVGLGALCLAAFRRRK